jgi:transformation/transcription domain-associated protein
MLLNHSMSMVAETEAFYQFRRLFAQQWSANCLLQYTFSAMDRAPSKIVFDYSGGRVHSTEFRLAYTNQGILENQHVPFRLTPNIEALIGFLFFDARYTTAMSVIAGAVHQSQQDLDPIFRLLMRDDLISYFTKSLAKSDSTTVEMEKQLAASVARNVAILHTRFAECAPSLPAVISKEQTNVDQRVRDLIDSARDPKNLCLMPGSYQGWM